jgi:hypothetical protein
MDGQYFPADRGQRRWLSHQTGQEVRSDLLFYVKPKEISLLANIPKKKAVPESCISQTANSTVSKKLLL